MKKDNNNSRRKFIKTTTTGTALMIFGLEGMGTVLNACSTPRHIVSNQFFTGFDQQPLPYAYDALETMIDARTMEIHYTKHAAGYSKNCKEAALAEGVNMQKPLEELLAAVSKYSVKIRNNGGGHYNHEMFWKCMRPATVDNKPAGNLLLALEKQFGSFAAFKTQFSDAAKNRFGSGWAWLIRDASGQLKTGSTANQDNPLMDIASIEPKGYPLLCLDVWEHAYYLKYQNKRADYIENWWSLVNWKYVEERFLAV